MMFLTTSPRTATRRLRDGLVVITGFMMMWTTVGPGQAVGTESRVDFGRDVLPILQTRCLECHGTETQESGLRLDSMLAALRGGDSGEPVVVPGESQRSYLIELVSSDDESMRMPPDGPPLSSEQTDTLKAWINAARGWESAKQLLNESRPDHWSYQPIVRPPVPAAEASRPIDAFVERKLRRASLAFSEQARRQTLIRRLYLVMHGLPPSPDQIQRFINDTDPDAWERLIEDVLASPRYGERMAMHWLDLVRFGETHGFETNRERPHAWRYRDWVINAFNDDQPYDEFIRHQIAGDAFGADVGTGFLVAGPYDLVKGQDPKLGLMQRQDELADMINTTGTAFMGLTLGCARCHNHKFDPITQTDYYSLQAVFAGVNHADRALPLDAASADEIADLEKRMVALRGELATFIQSDGLASRFIDDEPLGDALISPVEHLSPPAGKGTNPNGTEPGFADDRGSSTRSANLSGGRYTWWKNRPGEDFIAYRPAVAGAYRVWLSWGAGFATHSTDARYWIDRDGDLQTKDDRDEIARVDQQLFADGSGEVIGKPLWSGFYDAGVQTMTRQSAIVLQGGQHGTA